MEQKKYSQEILYSQAKPDGVAEDKTGLRSNEVTPKTAKRTAYLNVQYLLLAAYFFLNLALTLSNKALLGKVLLHLSLSIAFPSNLALTGSLPMATDYFTHHRDLHRLFLDGRLWVSEAYALEWERKSYVDRLLCPLHSVRVLTSSTSAASINTNTDPSIQEHRFEQCLTSNDQCTTTSDPTLHVSDCYYLDIPRGLQA